MIGIRVGIAECRSQIQGLHFEAKAYFASTLKLVSRQKINFVYRKLCFSMDRVNIAIMASFSIYPEESA